MGTRKELAPLCNLSFLVSKMERGSLRGKREHLCMCVCMRACGVCVCVCACMPHVFPGSWGGEAGENGKVN